MLKSPLARFCAQFQHQNKNANDQASKNSENNQQNTHNEDLHHSKLKNEEVFNRYSEQASKAHHLTKSEYFESLKQKSPSNGPTSKPAQKVKSAPVAIDDYLKEFSSSSKIVNTKSPLSAEKKTKSSRSVTPGDDSTITGTNLMEDHADHVLYYDKSFNTFYYNENDRFATGTNFWSDYKKPNS